MKFYILPLRLFIGLSIIASCYHANNVEQIYPSLSWSVPSPLSSSSPSSDTNLATDLNEIQEMIPTKDIYRLFLRYLLTDEQFQRIVRTLLTRDAYTIWKQFRSQPEVMALTKWTRMQLLLARDDVSSIEVSNELHKVIKNLQTRSNRGMNGWHNFVDEFLMLYPEDLLKSYINMKIEESGIFSQFWQKVKNVKAAYERILQLPETQNVLSQLENNGVNIESLDFFIRKQFDWLDS